MSETRSQNPITESMKHSNPKERKEDFMEEYR